MNDLETEKFSHQAPIATKTFFGSKVFRISIALILLIILTLKLTPVLINHSSLKIELEQKISQALNANFSSSSVSSSVFPLPEIIIKNAKITNYLIGDRAISIKASELRIRISVLALLSRDFKVTQIAISNAILEYYFPANKPRISNTELFANLPLKPLKAYFSIFPVNNLSDEQFAIQKIPSFKIKSSKAIFYDKVNKTKVFENINLKINNTTSELEAVGQFSAGKLVNELNLVTNLKQGAGVNSSKLLVNSPELNLSIIGTFTASSNNFVGKIDSKIGNIRNFYKNYIDENDFLVNKINPLASSIKLTADLSRQDKEVKINNLEIISDLINGDGEVIFDYNKAPTLDLELNFSNVNLDDLTIDNSSYENQVKGSVSEYDSLLAQLKDNKEDESGIKNSLSPEGEIEEMTSGIKGFETTGEVRVKSLNYLGGQIKDVDLYIIASTANHSILIQPLIFNVAGNGTVRVSGVLSGDSKNPKFIGNIDSSGKKLNELFKWANFDLQNLKRDNLQDYTLYADLLLLPDSLSLNNLYISLNNSKNELLGDVKIEKKNKITNIISQIEVNTFNVDDFFFTSNGNSYLSSGSLLKKMFWLNNINYNSIVSLKFDNLIYADESFSDQKLIFGLSQGYLEINSLELKSEDLDLQTSLTFDMRDKAPRLDITILAKKLFYTEVSKVEQDQQVSELTKNIEKSKNDAPRSLVDKFFDLPSLSGINGDLNFTFEDLKLNEISLKNLQIAGKMIDGNINVTTLKGDIFEGNFDYNGQIVIKGDKVVNGNLTLSKARIKPLLSLLFNQNKIDGTANMAISITSSAENKIDFIKNLELNCKLSASGIEIESFGLTDLIAKLFRPKTYLEELKNPQSILFNTASISKIDKATGQIKIGKDIDDKFQINFDAIAANGVFNGDIDLEKSTIVAKTNIIFLTGTREKQIPINIASNITGKISDPSQSTNLDQINQYLGKAP